MAVNGTKSAHKWTGKQALAAQLVAEDKLTDEVIAEKAGVPERTFYNWKASDWFQERVASIVEEIRQKILSIGVADRINRVAASNDRWERLGRVIMFREKRYKKKRESTPDDVPEEAETGVVVLKEVPSKFGIVREWAVDVGTLAEIRNIEKQVAIEKGEWQEKAEVSGSVTIVREYPEGV